MPGKDPERGPDPPLVADPLVSGASAAIFLQGQWLDARHMLTMSRQSRTSLCDGVQAHWMTSPSGVAYDSSPQKIRPYHKQFFSSSLTAC